MKARIYKPAKTAMQSGRAKTQRWVLEFEPADRKTIEPLMGWTSSGDTPQQLRLEFDTEADAIAYCRRQGLEHEISTPAERKIKFKSYASNFRWDRAG
jgi:ETC complex I subunit conserved region